MKNQRYTTHAVVVDLNIEANNIEEIINAIRQEFEKYPDMCTFNGRIWGFTKGKEFIADQDVL